MKQLARYEKLEIWILGIVMPACIMLWIVGMLFQGKSVFPGRHELIYFYGTNSYIVSALWFGISLGLVSRFLLRYTYFKNQKNKLNISYWLSITLIIIGLTSSIWLTFGA